ncbi:DUF998 domain-containing protein [Actinoplanes sp. NPDC049596]|uniref:DUF998 domain-containing protein n=1 Tax=unclassified Actinoplanes TaxID=2626549 RepID=UPI00342B6B5C
MRRALVIAGPLYVVVSLIEVVTRDGFDPTRHAWSVLANGEHGWIHTVTLIVSGILTVLGAAALRNRWIVVYGLGLIGAGLFRADAGRGFPPGTPETVPVSWHGTLHFVVSGIGFVALVVACLRSRRHMLFSRITGVAFLVTFVAMAATGGAAWSLLGFTAAVILASCWLSVIATEKEKAHAVPDFAAR